jgi:serine phosphatase RsbU (regulator of sigma subunit)
LGVGLSSRGEYVVGLGAADTLIAFTDGLIERRDEDITVGQDRLSAAVRALLGHPLSDTIPALVAGVGEPSRDDDIAVLGVRRLS